MLPGVLVLRQGGPRPDLHFPKLTWKLKRGPLKRTAVHKAPLVRFHVPLAECRMLLNVVFDGLDGRVLYKGTKRATGTRTPFLESL